MINSREEKKAVAGNSVVENSRVERNPELIYVKVFWYFVYLSPALFKFMYVLLKHVYDKNYAIVRHATLAKEVGCSISALKVYINELVKLNELKVEHIFVDGKQRASKYTILKIDKLREDFDKQEKILMPASSDTINGSQNIATHQPEYSYRKLLQENNIKDTHTTVTNLNTTVISDTNDDVCVNNEINKNTTPKGYTQPKGRPTPKRPKKKTMEGIDKQGLPLEDSFILSLIKSFGVKNTKYAITVTRQSINRGERLRSIAGYLKSIAMYGNPISTDTKPQEPQYRPMTKEDFDAYYDKLEEMKSPEQKAQERERTLAFLHRACKGDKDLINEHLQRMGWI